MRKKILTQILVLNFGKISGKPLPQHSKTHLCLPKLRENTKIFQHKTILTSVYQNLQKILKKTSNFKAPGIDGLSNVILKKISNLHTHFFMQFV